MMEERRLLLADDDQEFRYFMRDAVQEIGEEINAVLAISEAQDGQEAIDLFDQAIKDDKPFDIVVTDYKMPNANGAQVVRHVINAHPVPIIVLSAYKEAEAVNFLREGALIFISKPFSIDQISKAIETARAARGPPNPRAARAGRWSHCAGLASPTPSQKMGRLQCPSCSYFQPLGA